MRTVLGRSGRGCSAGRELGVRLCAAGGAETPVPVPSSVYSQAAQCLRARFLHSFTEAIRAFHALEAHSPQPVGSILVTIFPHQPANHPPRAPVFPRHKRPEARQPGIPRAPVRARGSRGGWIVGEGGIVVQTASDICPWATASVLEADPCTGYAEDCRVHREVPPKRGRW